MPFYHVFKNYIIEVETDQIYSTLPSDRAPQILYKNIELSIKGTQDWEFFWVRIWILYYFIYSDFVKKKQFFDWAMIGGDTIVLRSLRLRGLEFILVWD